MTQSSKEIIIDLFNVNVKGRVPDTSNANQNHDGREGHWLEQQMGISPNADNAPDLLGFEMKNQTNSKITFGDWSANYYIFKDKAFNLDRDRGFLVLFGKYNIEKDRYSWSGEPSPNLNIYNNFGQKLQLDNQNNILALYSYSEDKRSDKGSLIPPNLQQENLLLARWDASSMADKVNRKFNDKGWFKCERDRNGQYCSIAFGQPISWTTWLEGFNARHIFFDSGMYQGNKRNYSQWRANNTYWDSLITDRH